MSRATARIVLENRTLRWSTPGNLNDPFDNQFDLHVDVDQELVTTLAINKLWGAYLGVGEPRANTPAAIHVRELRHRRPGMSRCEFEAIFPPLDFFIGRLSEHARELHRSLRPHIAQHKLLCLATSETEIPMWTYYSENHCGVVLCFRCSSPDSFWSVGQAVRYHQQMPRLVDEEMLADMITGRASLADEASIRALLEKIVFTKAIAWRHEREWRVFSGLGRQAEAPFEDVGFAALDLDAIIVGCRMPAVDRIALVDLLRRKYPHAHAREAVLHERNFDLVIRSLEEAA